MPNEIPRTPPEIDAPPQGYPRWWDRHLERTPRSTPVPRLIRFGACAILACILMFIVLVAVSARGNVPPIEIVPAPTEDMHPHRPLPPTCQDFASEAQATRVEGWRRIFWQGTATSGAPKHAIKCVIDYEKVYAFDTAIEVGCKSGGEFQEVFFAEMRRHLGMCGFQVQGMP